MSQREYLVELHPRTLAGEELTLRYSRWGHTTRRTDTPPDVHYEQRLLDPGVFSATLPRPGSQDARTRVSYGAIELAASDGLLDALLEYGWAGCRARVLVGVVGAAYAEFEPMFDGLIEDLEGDEESVRVLLRGREWDWSRRPLQPLLYAGTNDLPDGLEGTASDLKGRTKPLAFGVVLNATVPCVNTSRLVYQVSSGEVASIDAVYDRGVLVAGESPGLIDDVINPGGGGSSETVYRFRLDDIDEVGNRILSWVPSSASDLPNGTPVKFRRRNGIGTLPSPLVAGTTYYVRQGSFSSLSIHTSEAGATGDFGRLDFPDPGHDWRLDNEMVVQAPAVTDPGVPEDTFTPAVDAEGSYFRLGTSPAGLVTADITEGAAEADRTPAQVMRRIALHRGLDAGDISSDDVTAMDAACDYQVGLYVDDERTANDALDQVARSVGGYWYFDAVGMLRMGLLRAPTGEPVGAIDEDDILSLSRERAAAQPAWKVTVRYARNWTRQTTDIAPAVDAERRAWLEAQYREAVVGDAAILDWCPGAEELVVETLLTEETDAQAEAQRLFELLSVRRETLRAEVRLTDERLAWRRGQVVRVTHSRYLLAEGRDMLLLGIQPDLAEGEGTLTLTLWG